MKHNAYALFAVLALLFASLVSGCTRPTQAPDTDVGGTMDLDGTTWTLAELPGRDLLPEYTVTLDLAGGQASGNATCNRFFGAYEVYGTRLSFGPLAATEMACSGLDQERAYLSALGTISAYRVDGDRLVLLNTAGDVVLAFAPTRHATLEGTAWQLTGYHTGSAIRSVLSNTQITATWADGQVKGTAGCNSYSGSYQVDGEQLTVGPIGATKMHCGAPAGLMAQEQDYLNALASAAAYRIKGNRLVVLGSDGGLLLEYVVAQK